ncbi:MAG: hypothetical protein ACI9Y1_003234 [Lentisphaeria bacterium]|jgi:hypothetical protein
MAKALSKTQKKLDKTIRLALTDVCEQALEEIAGFTWLTHQVNYANFPASLFITCVFESNSDLSDATAGGHTHNIQQRIQAKLLKAGVKLKRADSQILFDSEENCSEQHDGNWQLRLETRKERAVSKGHPGH